MRKIEKSEIKELAMVMADCFVDYPLYNVFFPDDEKKLKRVFYFFWYRIYTRMNFTYVNDDKSLVTSYQKPGEKLKSAFGLFLNPSFLFGFIKNIPFKSIKLVFEFGDMESPLEKKHYNPETDGYVHAVCVLKKSRAGGAFLSAIKEFDDGRPIFCVTHTDRNVRLYKHLGLEVVDQAEWHGVNHYVLKRRELNDRKDV